MKINCCGHRVLLKLVEFEDVEPIPDGLKDMGFKVKAGMEAGDDRRAKVSQDQGVIIGVGPTAWKHPDLGGQPWAKIGDRVIFGRHSGKLIVDPKTNEEWYLCNDEDIQAILED